MIVRPDLLKKQLDIPSEEDNYVQAERPQPIPELDAMKLLGIQYPQTDMQETANTMTEPQENEEESIVSTPSQADSVTMSQAAPSPQQSKLEKLLSEYRNLQQTSGDRLSEARLADSKTQMINTMLGGADKIANAFANRAGITKINNQTQGLSADQAKNIQTDLARETASKGQEFTMQSQIDKFKADEQARKDAEKLKRDLADIAAKNKTSNETGLTKGQEAVDKDYAKHFNTFTQQGRNNAINSIEKLKKLQQDVAKDTGFGEAGGGRIASLLPDAARSSLAIERRDDAFNFANKTLKELFGGQLSDAEREAAAREFWNDKLDNASNAKRLAGKIKELEDNLRTQTAKAEYFNQAGTLKGFDINEKSPSITETPTQAPYGDEVKRNGKTYKWNPTVGKYQLK